MAGIPSISSYRLPHRDEIAPNVAPWQVDPQRAVLLVHDMQRFFLRPLPPQDLASALVGNVETLIGRARALGMPVAYTAQPGGMTPQQRGLLRDFWGEGMKVDPQDRHLDVRCASRDGDWLLTKWRYSAFFNTDLLRLMREHGKQQLIICGVYAHIGILATAIEAFSHDIETFIVSDAVADFSRQDHVATLNYAAQACACIVATGEVLA